MEANAGLHQRLREIKEVIDSEESKKAEDSGKRSGLKRREVTNEPLEEAERFREEKGGRFETEGDDIYVVYEEEKNEG